MALSTCRACGAVVPAHAHACPVCGAARTSGVSAVPANPAHPAAPLAYAPLPPRPAPPPERPWWQTVRGWFGAAGWVVVLAGLFFICRGIYLQYRGADQRALEAAEVKQEKEHARKVFVWVQDTLATTLVEGSAGRPAPGTEPAKRVWAVGRMLADRWTWEREIMQRHGVAAHNPPDALGTAAYQAGARAYPQVGRYLEGRAAAIAEIQKGSAAWVEGRMAVLARESGMTVDEIRGLFPPGFGNTAGDAAPHADALLAFHRHLVRVDPRVRPAGGDELLWQREDEAHRSSELAARANAAALRASRAREQRILRERAAFSGLLQ